MKKRLLEIICCPTCQQKLELADHHETDGEIVSGRLTCRGCRQDYSILRGVPRFVSPENYASNFGLQWQKFRQTQLDSYTGLSISHERFYRQTDWSKEALGGKLVLEVGCGAGRFTEIVLAAGAEVVALDYSAAVDACYRNFSAHPRFHVVQGDIYHLPFRKESFDYLFCFGVLQHTPDVKGALLALPPQLKPGGWLAVDIYPKHWSNWIQPKYWLRPITRHLADEDLFTAINILAPKMLAISFLVSRIPCLGKYLRRLVPVANYSGVYPLNARQLREWAILDTFDWLGPQYDQPQSADTLRIWLEEAGLEQLEIIRLGHLTGRARKP